MNKAPTLPYVKTGAAEKNTRTPPRVVILSTGGTIAKAGSSLTDYSASATLSMEQIAGAIPALSEHVQLRIEQLSSLGSSNLTFSLLLKAAGRINELLASDEADGIVVTHGTDTMEETAYFLNLVVKSKKPVVLVGAMRPAEALSADGPLNLLQALQVAGSVKAAGYGVLVVQNGKINAAREVTKTSTTQVETFNSRDMGFLGYVVDNEPALYRRSTRKHTVDTPFDVSGLTALPKVEIVLGYLDASLDGLNGIIAGQPAGIVCAAFGNGRLPDLYSEKLAEASKNGIVVVRCSRVGTGVVTSRTSDAGPDFLVADNLTPQKARILLMLALTLTRNTGEIRQMFQTY